MQLEDHATPGIMQFKITTVKAQGPIYRYPDRILYPRGGCQIYFADTYYLVVGCVWVVG